MDAQPAGASETSPDERVHFDDLVFNPWVIVYRDVEVSDGLVVEDLASKRRFTVDDPLLLSMVLAAGRGLDAVRKTATTAGLSEREAIDGIVALRDMQVLCPSTSSGPREFAAAAAWRDRYWHDALVYHRAIRDFPFLDYESAAARAADDESMAAYAEQAPPPPIYRTYDAAHPRIPLRSGLDLLDKADIFQLLLDDVESRRTGFPETVSIEQISTVLYATFGETGWVEFPHQGRFLLKTSPSGGARHPTEAYIYSLDTDVPEGLYHYSVAENALVRLPRSLTRESLLDAAYELRTGPHFPVRLVVILTSVVGRSMWRYREPRSYRVLLNDVGHLLETLKIVAKATGLETYFGHGFHDDRLEQLIGVSSVEEPALKIVAIG